MDIKNVIGALLSALQTRNQYWLALTVLWHSGIDKATKGCRTLPPSSYDVSDTIRLSFAFYKLPGRLPGGLFFIRVLFYR